ncbi:MAG TPA: YdeI/OmpD-associated family protein [Dokdonella sp.]
MGTKDPRVDAYIADAAAFAQPILTRLRAIVHEACPDVDETIKWRMPFFERRGRPFCHMAAFKRHCAFGFWRGREVVGERRDGAMGQFGRIDSLDALPPKRTLIADLERAVARADALAAAAAAPRAAARKPAPATPPDLAAALAKHAAARRAFEAFSPSHRREYVEWIAEAKREQTRAKRIATALEWLAEGKPRNWKYMNGSGSRG